MTTTMNPIPPACLSKNIQKFIRTISLCGLVADGIRTTA